MTYQEWFDDFAQKHKRVVDKLLNRGLNKEQIIDYFDFDNMVQKEPNFCPLYAQNKKCHQMKSLNCYLCACPNFRFNDRGFQKVEERTKYSFCDIDSKDGRVGVYGDAIHQDCSGCVVPHYTEYIEKRFGLDWKKMMSECHI